MLLTASFLAILMQSANFSSAYGFTPILAQQLGASKEDLGILLFWYLLPNTLATLLSGTIIRRYLADRLILLAGFLLMSAALFATPLVNGLSLLKFIQAVNGFGIGLLFPLLMSLSLQAVPREQQATAMGFFQSLYTIGMTLGPVLSGIIAQEIGLSSVFVLNGLMGLAGAAFSFYRVPLSSGEES
jgi:MFS family permease